jgi:hypothetical protein
MSNRSSTISDAVLVILGGFVLSTEATMMGLHGTAVGALAAKGVHDVCIGNFENAAMCVVASGYSFLRTRALAREAHLDARFVRAGVSGLLHR